MDQSATRPAGLYVVGIGAMLFGLLGMCTQGLTVVSTAQQRGSMSQMQADFGDESFRQLAELQSTTYLPNLLSASFGVIVALALLVFGAMTVARLSVARLTPAVLIGAAAVELVQLALTLYFQMKMADVMRGMAGGLDAGPGGGLGLGGMMSAAMGIGLCLVGGWAVGKCAFFGAGAAYLRKPEIRRLFGSPAPLGPRGD